MEQKKAVKGPRPASEDFLPWKLIPIDLESTPNGSTRTERPPSFPMQRPTSSTSHPSIPDAIPVELTDTTFMELRSVLSKICGDENMVLLEEDISNESVPPCPIPKSTSSVNSESIIEDAVVNQLETSLKNVEHAAKPTPLLENESKRPASPSPKPKRISSMKPSSLIQNAVEKPAKKSSKISANESKIDDEDKILEFIHLVRKFPHLHEMEDSSEKTMKRKEESWTKIGEVLDMAVNDCLKMWNKLCVRNKRNKKRLADGENLTKKTMRFLEMMNFLPSKEKSGVKRKNISEDYTLPVSVPKKRKKAESSASQSIPVEKKPTDSVSYSTPKIRTFMEKEIRTRDEGPNSDLLFANEIAMELERIPPHSKHLIKAQIWQLFAALSHPV